MNHLLIFKKSIYEYRFLYTVGCNKCKVLLFYVRWWKKSNKKIITKREHKQQKENYFKNSSLFIW